MAASCSIQFILGWVSFMCELRTDRNIIVVWRLLHGADKMNGVDIMIVIVSEAYNFGMYGPEVFSIKRDPHRMYLKTPWTVFVIECYRFVGANQLLYTGVPSNAEKHRRIRKRDRDMQRQRATGSLT